MLYIASNAINLSFMRRQVMTTREKQERFHGQFLLHFTNAYAPVYNVSELLAFGSVMSNMTPFSTFAAVIVPPSFVTCVLI